MANQDVSRIVEKKNTCSLVVVIGVKNADLHYQSELDIMCLV